MRRRIIRTACSSLYALAVMAVAAPARAASCIQVPFKPQIDLTALPGSQVIQQVSNWSLTYVMGALLIGGIVAVAFAVASRRAVNAGGQAGAMETVAKFLGAGVAIGALATLLGIAVSVGNGVTC